MMMKDQIVPVANRKCQDISNEGNKEVISKLKRNKLIHSIIIFGSRAKGTETERSDLDICIIPKPDVEVTLKDRISMDNSVPENIDISLLNELPVYIRKSIFLEGKVLYTQDMYYILTLAKINDLDYERYKRLNKDYHKHVMERVRAKMG